MGSQWKIIHDFKPTEYHQPTQLVPCSLGVYVPSVYAFANIYLSSENIQVIHGDISYATHLGARL